MRADEMAQRVRAVVEKQRSLRDQCFEVRPLLDELEDLLLEHERDQLCAPTESQRWRAGRAATLSACTNVIRRAIFWHIVDEQTGDKLIVAIEQDVAELEPPR